MYLCLAMASLVARIEPLFGDPEAVDFQAVLAAHVLDMPIASFEGQRAMMGRDVRKASRTMSQLSRRPTSSEGLSRGIWSPPPVGINSPSIKSLLRRGREEPRMTSCGAANAAGSPKRIVKAFAPILLCSGGFGRMRNAPMSPGGDPVLRSLRIKMGRRYSETPARRRRAPDRSRNGF